MIIKLKDGSSARIEEKRKRRIFKSDSFNYFIFFADGKEEKLSHKSLNIIVSEEIKKVAELLEEISDRKILKGRNSK